MLISTSNIFVILGKEIRFLSGKSEYKLFRKIGIFFLLELKFSGKYKLFPERSEFKNKIF